MVNPEDSNAFGELWCMGCGNQEGTCIPKSKVREVLDENNLRELYPYLNIKLDLEEEECQK